MADFAFTYYLPKTVFDVTITKDTQLVSSEEGFTSTATTTTVDLAVTLEADHSSRQSVSIESGLLEKNDLKISFSDDGTILGVNASGSRDPSPIITMVATAVKALAPGRPLAGRRSTEGSPGGSTLADGPVFQESESLEKKWQDNNSDLVEIEAVLMGQAKRLLELMADPSTGASAIVETARALEVVQSQLAAIGGARRAWMTAKIKDSVSRHRLNSDDLLRLERGFPESLTDSQVGDMQTEFRERFDFFVAVSDPDRPENNTGGPGSFVDAIGVRRARPVSIGVYRRSQATENWLLDASSVRSIDVVDRNSPVDAVNFNGRWLRNHTVGLQYYGDGSLKSLEFITEFGGANAVAAVGEAVSAFVSLKEKLDKRPTERDIKTSDLEAQARLLTATRNLDALIATQGRAQELAILEQEKRIRDSQG